MPSASIRNSAFRTCKGGPFRWLNTAVRWLTCLADVGWIRCVIRIRLQPVSHADLNRSKPGNNAFVSRRDSSENQVSRRDATATRMQIESYVKDALRRDSSSQVYRRWHVVTLDRYPKCTHEEVAE